MKSILIAVFVLFGCSQFISSQTLDEAKALYLEGQYAKALPAFEREYNENPTDPSLNQWYGVCLFETGGNMDKAEECLLVASKKRIRDSFYYLGMLYTLEYRFTDASAAYDSYEKMLKKKGDDAEKDKLEERKNEMGRLRRMVSNTEDIRVIDSLVVDKAGFLSAYKLSPNSGHLDYYNSVFPSGKLNSTVYSNEKGTRIYYAKPEDSKYTLFSMDKLMDEYSNEKKLSANNFGLVGDINYPFIMPDGVTIYFAAKDENGIGGYDLFISRYNLNNDTYLAPERLNMPFNSPYNDYMMAVDEEKGVGWFASDRFQPEGKVCIYTFVPNEIVKIIDSEDEAYLAMRASISSIRKSWEDGANYSALIAQARKEVKKKAQENRDFEFVINDQYTYYKLDDFKDSRAEEMYKGVLSQKKELKNLSDKLEEQRTQFAKATSQDAKLRMTNDILAAEKEYERLQAAISENEINARNTEIKSLPAR